jgi:2-methylcitrate dehydratase
VTLVEHLAAFVVAARFEQLSRDAIQALKLRVLDSLGCALGALEGPPILALRRYLDELGGRERATLIGGGRTSPDRAALYNGALVRYLDFNDSFLAPGETCHPSDNLAPVLAAAEHAGRSGRDLLLALGVAYQVHCRLSELAPVRARGFDHTTQGAYATAAGVAKALGLDAAATANAIAIAGTAFNALRVTRTGDLSHWKGLAYPNTAFAATHAAFLARAGVTGPREVFEGNKGFMDSIAGRFEIDWEREDLEKVRDTSLKRFNAEVHAQSTVEALLELRAEHDFRPEDIERVELRVFQVALDIIGGGAEGAKKHVRTKEEADHSLPYMAAVALLDGQLLPEQYTAVRIARPDVQSLLQRVDVTADDELTRRFPGEHGCRVRIRLRDGRVLAKEKHDYEGYRSRPMRWTAVLEKFERLASRFVDPETRGALMARVEYLEAASVTELCALLGRRAQAGIAGG